MHEWIHGLLDRVVDSGQCLDPAEAVIDKHPIKAHGQAWHVLRGKTDRSSALQGEGQQCGFDHQVRSIEVDLIHGLSTGSSPESTS